MSEYEYEPGNEGVYEEGYDPAAYDAAYESQPQQVIVNATANSENTQSEEGIALYRFLGIFFFLLSAGGLFIGMLGKVTSVFAHLLITSPANIFDYSLLGQLINFFKDFAGTFQNIGQGFQEGVSVGLHNSFYVLFVFLVAIAAVVSVAMMIVTLAAKKKDTAARAAFASGILSFAAYGGLLFFTYIMRGLTGEANFTSLIDIPLLVIAGLLLLTLFIGTFVRSKGQGAANAFTFLLTALAAVMLFYPATTLGALSFVAFDTVKESVFLGIGLSVLYASIVFNLIVSLIRLNAKKAFVFDIVRFSVQLLGFILTMIATMVPPVSAAGTLFTGAQLLPTVFLIVATVAALVVGVFALVITKMKKTNEEAQQRALEEHVGPEAEEGGEPAYYDDQPTNVVITIDAGELVNRGQTEQTVAEPAPAPVPEIAAEAAEAVPAEPEPEPEPIPDPEPVQEPATYFQPAPEQPEQKTPNITSNIYVQTSAPAPTPQQPIYTQPASAPEPVVVKEVIREIVKEPERNERELSEFELRMEALARGEFPEPAKQEPRSYTAPARKPSPSFEPSANSYKTRARGNGGGNAGNYMFDGSQYTYDPFINTLTPSEKNEFGDVFIANLYGVRSFLPTYVIGGDNKEFFSRVFICLGHYRGFISQELMEKIYAYVNKT